jgi:hypothetical protein
MRAMGAAACLIRAQRALLRVGRMARVIAPRGRSYGC